MRKTLSIAFSMVALAAATSFAQAPVLNVTPKSATATRLLPGTRSGVLSTIEGKALNSVNSPMTDTGVRLRDARSGQILQTTLTDKQGAFIFREIDPGTYVVEIVGPGKTVLASSPLINIGTGEALSALVRVPFQASTLTGVLGGSQSAASAITNAAWLVTTAAAAGNVGAQTLSGAAATTTTTSNGR